VSFLRSETEAALKDIRQYRPDIDGLKAIAVLSVIVFHYASSWVPGGFIGVDIFFVISGYLIGRSTLIEIQSRDYSVLRYFARRAKRIFPSLILLLAFLWVAGWLVLLPEEYASLGKHMGAASVFISNWLLWREIGYFDVAAELKPLLNLWSLGVEEQFYLVFPLFIWLGLKLRRQVFLLLILLAIGSLWLSETRVGTHAGWAYYHPVSRIWELLAGSLLAYTELHFLHRALAGVANNATSQAYRWQQGVTAHALSAFGLTLIACALFLYDKALPFPGLSAVLPVLGALLIISSGPTACCNRWLLARPAMIYVGLISYPLYLWHWPLIASVRLVDGAEPGPAIKLVLVALTFGISMLSYHLVERPIRFGRFSRNKGLAPMLWAVLLCLGALGFTTFKAGGFPQRFVSETTAPEALPAAAVLPPLSGKKVVLIGDSHAGVLKSALTDYYRQRGETLEVFDQGGCAPFWNLDRHDPGHEPQGCPKIINRGIETALEDPDVTTVIFAGRLDTLNHLFDSGNPATDTAFNVKHDDRARNYQLLASAVDQTLQRFVGKNKRVILIDTVPSMDFDPGLCRWRPVRFGTTQKDPCVVLRSVVDAQQAEFRAVFGTAAQRYPFVRVFDPLPTLCDAAVCYGSQAGVMLYSDDSHLTPDGVARVRARFDF
jgi:peptidoglycan/LPS O-acetylase OafA/YrhL